MGRMHVMVAIAALTVVTVVLAQGPPAQGPQGGRGRGRARTVQVQPGEECPPGTTLVRVGLCQFPEFPPPTIVDYRPKSTLVVEQHPVSKAKFPVIDIHNHARPGAQDIDRMVREMDAMNLRVAVLANNDSGPRLQQQVTAIRGSAHANRFRVLAGVDFRNVGPGWADKAVAQLEADVKAGAVGVGEIPKQAGMTIKKADGSRLRIDDPNLDPLWDAAARLNLPVFLHTADPEEFFHQPDMHNERWLELSLYPDRRWYLNKDFTFEQLLAERDALFRKHPRTRFIAAHFGWKAADLGALGTLLDTYPNVTTEMGAILYDLGRQPRAAHDFFLKYQDRLLFGKDTYAPSEFPYYWRVLETKDDYFDYYRDYHAFWKLYGIDLPDAVLKKVYFENALRVTPGLPQTGWPR